jgi:cellulose synthase/poly-beta-1,6-N-acetylglucosamine synthase-like glycosyltransferase
VNSSAWLLEHQQHAVLILIGATIGYTALAVGYSLLQWSYASRYRGEWSKAARARQAGARHDGSVRYETVDVIVPCYNEKPDLLAATCTALQRQTYPGRIHVWLVDDGSETIEVLEPIYREVETKDGWSVIRHERNRGKRRAQHSAFRHANGAYVLTVDSDTVLADDCVARLAAAMKENPRAGAISGYVRARNASTNRLTRLINQRYEFLFRQERAAQSWHNAVTCCSGPVSIYRRSVLNHVWSLYVEDTFLGRQRHFGDDLKLSLLILEHTYDSLYWPSAKAWTTVPETIRGYARQQIRWNKSYYRELFRTHRALRKHLSDGYLVLHRSRYLQMPSGHRYLRFELAARVLVPLLPPVLLVAGSWVALAGYGETRWLPLLATVIAMLLHGTVIGLQARSWSFPLLYGPIHLGVLSLVRVRALLTLGDSRWGTRNVRNVLRPFRAARPMPTAVPVRTSPVPGPPAAERVGS